MRRNHQPGHGPACAARTLLRTAATIALCLSMLHVTHAGLDAFDFTGPVSEDRFRAVIAEVRCLVCQNESLLGSQAELAQDLREEVYNLMAQGKSDDEIIRFLTDRYGNFVLYDPPLDASTYILWFGPFVLLVITALIFFVTVRRRNRVTAAPITGEDQTRVDRLLDATERPHPDPEKKGSE